MFLRVDSITDNVIVAAVDDGGEKTIAKFSFKRNKFTLQDTYRAITVDEWDEICTLLKVHKQVVKKIRRA